MFPQPSPPPVGLDVLPDAHLLHVAPNLDAAWLFDAARRYVEVFSPTILGQLELLTLLPPDATVVVTLIARRDTADRLAAAIIGLRPGALVDRVVYDLLEAAQAALDDRALRRQPFGVPLRPTATPAPLPTNATRAPLVLTPGALPLGPGFITQTPPPDSTPTKTPTPTVLPQGDVPSAPPGGPAPLTPTPGSVVGQG